MSTRTLRACAIVLFVTTFATMGRAQVTVLRASLDGGQEVPPSGSLASGELAMSIDQSTNLFNLAVFVKGIALTDLTGSHIHLAPAGVNGPIIVDLDASQWFESGGAIGRTILEGSFPAANVAALLSEGTYINVHTTQFPGGEIRGQIVPEPSTVALLFSGLGVLALRRRNS